MTVGGVDVGDRRRLTDHFAADGAEDREGSKDDDGEGKPVTLVIHDFVSS